MSKSPVWKERSIGALGLCALGAFVVGTLSQTIPDGLPGIGALARMGDNLRPQSLVLSLALFGAIFGLGGRWFGLVGMLATVATSVFFIAEHRSRVAPVGQRTDVTVLWFNALNENQTPAERLATAIVASDADVVVLTEARAVPVGAQSLQSAYPHRVECTRPPRCNMLVLSKFPIRDSQMSPLQLGPDRVASFTVALPKAPHLTIFAAHPAKPWYQSLSISDQWAVIKRLRAVMDARAQTLVLGDFNAALWSRRMLSLERRFDLRHPARVLGTWPVQLGAFAVPIDHALFHGDIGVTSLRTWGQGLGSNHFGLLMALDLGAGSETETGTGPARDGG